MKFIMFYRSVPLLFAVFSMYRSVSGAPLVLTTFSEFVDYASNGAAIMVSVNHSLCVLDFPKNLLAYSFTERLDFAIINEDTIEFNRETPVNGSRLRIFGPAIRLIAMRLDSSGQAKLIMSDTDWESRATVTSGSMICHMGMGLRVTATSEKGTQFKDFPSVVSALEGGYRVLTFIDLANCPEKPPKDMPKFRANGIQLFGEVIDHRFSSGGDFAFSKQLPYLDATFRFLRGYGDVKTNTDGTADLYYWEFDPKRAIPPRRHFQCALGQSIKYFGQS